MFNSSLKYVLVQVKKNKHINRESFFEEYIYKFYRHNQRCCIKYIASVKTYPNGLLTLDYYPKINLTPKLGTNNNMQDLRYRMMTRQNSFGIIGGTILDIMIDVQKRSRYSIWGFLAASLPNEQSNENNRRYQVYIKILSRTFIHKFVVFGNRRNSIIFVMPKNKVTDKEEIIKHYEHIFSETN